MPCRGPSCAASPVPARTARVGGRHLAVPHPHQYLRRRDAPPRRLPDRRDLAHAARRGTAGAGSPPEQRIDLQRALARVPREARVLLALRYVDGLSYREMARIRGITVNTVKSQLARGKSILRTALQRGGREAMLNEPLDALLTDYFRPVPGGPD